MINNGIYCSYCTNLTIENSTFNYLTGKYGGAVKIINTNISMSDSTIGVYPSNITINNSYFINLIGYSGGAIYAFGYA